MSTRLPVRAARRRRGFSLVELMVAGGITVTVVAFTLATFISQQRAFMSLDLARIAQESSRDALMDLEPALRRAGFGVEPRYAFDFRNYACASPTTCFRDKVADPDELVFYSRNPWYRWVDNGAGTCTTPGGCFTGNSWQLVATGTTFVTINARTGDVFHKGRVILAACANGLNMTMATVASTITVGANATISVPILPTLAGDPYKENAWNACHIVPGAAVFLVDRYRYMIKPFVVPPSTVPTPYLMLDTGLDLNKNGSTPDVDAADVIPVTAGVEDMQIAYVLNRGTSLGFAAPDNGNDWVVGNTPGTVEQPNPGLAAPIFGTNSTDAIRFNLHPANIRGVRVNLVVRGTQPDPGPTDGWHGDALLPNAQAIENRSTDLANNRASRGRFRRVRVSSSITVRDMESRSPFIF